MKTVLARACLSISVALLVAPGLATSASADPGTPSGVDANPFESTPANPYAAPRPAPIAGEPRVPATPSGSAAPIASAPAVSASRTPTAPTPSPPATSAPTASTPIASAPTASAPSARIAPIASATVASAPSTPSEPVASTPNDGAPDADAAIDDALTPELDMATLAERAADVAPPAPADAALEALDAVLLDGTADPISGVSTPAPRDEDTGLPSREAVRRAIEAVTPAIRACVDEGQSGRLVSVHSVFTRAGRVAIAEVEASTAHVSPQQRSCMARAARGARTEPFEQERFEVTFPVRL